MTRRRDFIKTIGLATAGAFTIPYILPSGRLFAETGSRKSNHVVFCLFAGGIRNIESVKQEQSNLMETILKGSFVSQSGIDDALPSSPLGSSRLQEFGTLLREFRYADGPTGHFNGHTTAITGKYTNTSLNLRARPEYPTIFEYYRKHTSPSKSALNCWWVCNTLGANTSLNYSTYEGYGSLYGANYIQPTSLITEAGYNVIGNPKNFSDDEYEKAKKIRDYVNKNFNSIVLQGDAGITNTEDDAEQILDFFNTLYTEAINGDYDDPWGVGSLMNNDLYNVFYAEKILSRFQPELLVVNLTGVDICHDDFTGYCNNLRLADWAVSHLWSTIQNTPGMEDAILIVAPEHGRNLNSNSIVDAYGRSAYDHTNDDTSREIFCLLCGPSSVIKHNNEVSSVYGESIDIVPSIANILGIDTDIPAGLLDGKVLSDVFV
jgi:hypothetical protein